MEVFLNSLNSFIVIIIVGALLLLSFLLMSNLLKVNRKANVIFGALLILWASFWSEEVLILIEGKKLKSSGLDILRVFQLLAPVLLYYSILYFTNPYRKLRKIEILHLVVPFFFVISSVFTAEINVYFDSNFIFIVLMLLVALFYIINSFLLLKKHEKRVELFNASREAVDLKWIKQIIVGLLVIIIFITGFNLIVQGENMNILGNGLMLFVIFYIAYHSMSQKEIFLLDKGEIAQILQQENEKQQVRQELIPEEEVRLLKEKLMSLMDVEKPYLEGDLNLTKLARELHISPHHLSFVLNKGFNKNFFQFINSYRVEEAKARLLSKKYNHLSIMGIGYDSGFNSKTAFNTVFKKYTGKTPSSFKQNSSSG